jgi:hypothetical protein
MMEHSLDVQVILPGGRAAAEGTPELRVQAGDWTAEEGSALCPAQGPGHGPARCELDRRWTPRSVDPAPGLSLDEERCVLTTAQGAEVQLPAEEGCDADSLGASADGRYALYTTISGQGDYLYSRLSVVDLEAGQIVEGLSPELTAYHRVSWSPDRRSLLIGEALIVLEGEPRSVEVGESAVFVTLP